MLTNRGYVGTALAREESMEDLAPQNFKRINTIMATGGSTDDIIFETVMDLKILRMKKVMSKYKRIILTKEQAREIWGKSA